MTLETLLLEEQGNIAILKINRPKALNALNAQVLDELTLALMEIGKKKNITALVITGEGEKSFIAGADISSMATMNRDAAFAFARKGQNVTQLFEALPVPIIAAVNGFCLGGGCEMAMSCDFIIASEKALFGQPEVALGLIPGFGGCVRLADHVGWPMARELIYTGRKISASEALRCGLVNKVASPESLMSEAIKIANEIGANSPLAVRAAKVAMRKIRSENDYIKKLELEADTFSGVFESHDQKEGVSAFLEKRKPNFKGE